MLSLIDKATGEAFLITPDTQISLSEQNSLYSDPEGSYSLPFTLPLRGKNLKLLGFPNLPTTALHQQEPAIECILDAGFMQKRGKLVINSINLSDHTAECNLLIGESLWRQKASETTLPQVMKAYRWQPHYSLIQANETRYWLDNGVNENIFRLQMDALRSMHYGKGEGGNTFFTCFPIKAGDTILNATTREAVGAELGVYSDHSTYTNAYAFDALSYTRTTRYNQELEAYDAWDIHATNYQNQTVFLYLDFVLDCVFTHLGLHFDDSNLLSEEWFNKAVILNNTCDTFAPGFIPYEVLVPDMTVSEFLTAICDFYGLHLMEYPNGKIMLISRTEILQKTAILPEWKIKQSLQLNITEKQDFLLSAKYLRDDDDAEVSLVSEIFENPRFCGTADLTSQTVIDNAQHGDLYLNSADTLHPYVVYQMRDTKDDQDNIVHAFHRYCDLNQCDWLYDVNNPSDSFDTLSVDVTVPTLVKERAYKDSILPVNQQYSFIPLFVSVRQATTVNRYADTPDTDCPLAMVLEIYTNTCEYGLIKGSTYQGRLVPHGVGANGHYRWGQMKNEKVLHEVTFTAWLTPEQIAKVDLLQPYVIFNYTVMIEKMQYQLSTRTKKPIQVQFTGLWI